MIDGIMVMEWRYFYQRFRSKQDTASEIDRLAWRFE
jgi:hypothetical protein